METQANYFWVQMVSFGTKNLKIGPSKQDCPQEWIEVHDYCSRSRVSEDPPSPRDRESDPGFRMPFFNRLL